LYIWYIFAMKNNGNMLKEQFDFYLKHQEEFVKLYNNLYIVIKDFKVIGKYDTYENAYFETLKTEELGTFIIQLCTPGSEAYTQTFHSRAIFA
jgi:hypothetical protein